MQIAYQLTKHPEWPTGTRVACTQLHGPGMVLIGDAAHGISPRIGNGMTSALEDAWLLDQVCRVAGEAVGVGALHSALLPHA